MKQLKKFLKPIFFFFFLLFFLQLKNVSAQTSIEALNEKLNSAQEIDKAEIHNKIAETFKYEIDKKGLILQNGELALKYAKKYKQIDQKSLALSNIGRFYLWEKEVNTAKKFADKALKSAKISGSAPALLYVYELMADAYSSESDYFGMLNSFKDSLSVYTQQNDIKNMALFTHTVGSIYYRLGDRKSWFEYVEKALSLYKEAGNESNAIQMMDYLTKYYLDLGDLVQAESLIKSALALSEKTKDYSMFCRTSLLVMEKCWLTNDVEGLKVSQEKLLATAQNIERRITKDYWLFAAWEYLARGQIKLKKYNEAVQSLNSAFEYKFEDNAYKRSNSADGYYLLGEAHIGLMNYKEAIKNLLENILVITENAENDSLSLKSSIMTYNKIAFSQIGMNNFNLALQALNKGQKLIVDFKKKTIIADKAIIKEHHQLMAKVLEKLGKHKKSQKHFKLSEQL